ncbi:MAG TPA: hypothetical protein VEX88_07830 [Glaciibacter sp.]|nr:hypothetical protein [Glaciibacter sp.]
MSDNTEPRFDPRHDPIYQRGYQQGAGHPESPRPDVVGRVDAQPVIPTEPAHSASSSSRVAPTAASGPATDSGESVQPAIPDNPPVAETQRNPYFLGLWIGASALIVAGLALEWRSVAMADYGYTSAPGDVPLEAIIQQLTWVVAPIMITVGALTIVALLFWRAVHWRPSLESGREGSPLRKFGRWS